MTQTRRDELMCALADVEAWHNDPASTVERRRGYMTRKSLLPREVVGRPGVRLTTGMSRLITAAVVGAGTEGVAVRVHQADYLEPSQFPGGQAPRHRTIVKLRRIEQHNGVLSVSVRQTVARELVQGLVAASIRLPFVAGITHWWLWDGAPAPRPTEAYHVVPQLHGAVPYDISDLFDARMASEVRRRCARQMSELTPAPGSTWDQHYLNLRLVELQRLRVTVLPLVVIEQPNAGETTLWNLLCNERLAARSDDNWRFVRAQLRLVAAMTAYLQEHHQWIHGDMSLNNIVMAQRADLPRTFDWLSYAVDVGELRLRGSSHIWVPTFADLSRSAIKPERVQEAFSPGNRLRSPTFYRDAIAYVDGYDGGRGFARTADMRRVGLTLAMLIMRQVGVADAPLAFTQLDARLVRVARLLLDAPAAWANVDFRCLRSHTTSLCTARSPTFQAFVANILWTCDLLDRVERMATPTPPADADVAYVRQRMGVFAAVSTAISHDLNPYLGWLMAQQPQLDAPGADMRQPALVARWNVLCDPL